MALKDFASRLNQLIKDDNLSKKGLAKKAGVQQKSILNYVNGKFYPRYDSLIKLANTFEVSTDYLLAIENYSFAEHFDNNPIDKVPNIFRTRLKELIDSKGITEAQLSRALNIEQSTVSKWHHQKTMPEIDLVIKIAQFFGCTIDFLLGRAS